MINSVHPETPSPLAGEGWGDHKRRVLKFSILATSTLSLPEAVKKFCGFQIAGLETTSLGLPRFGSQVAMSAGSIGGRKL